MSEKFYLYVIDIYEKKLKELMGEEEYQKFVIEVLKDFCIKNFDMIVGGNNE